MSLKKGLYPQLWKGIYSKIQKNQISIGNLVHSNYCFWYVIRHFEEYLSISIAYNNVQLQIKRPFIYEIHPTSWFTPWGQDLWALAWHQSLIYSLSLLAQASPYSGHLSDAKKYFSSYSGSFGVSITVTRLFILTII